MLGAKSKAATARPTIIGKGTVIEGSIRAQGPIQIDGRIEGTLICETDASVGETGTVRGDVVADDLHINGRVEGSVQVRAHLHVGSTGSVSGETRYGSLEVERGGVLDGSALQGEDVVTIEVEVLEERTQSAAVPQASGA